SLLHRSTRSTSVYYTTLFRSLTVEPIFSMRYAAIFIGVESSCDSSLRLPGNVSSSAARNPLSPLLPLPRLRPFFPRFLPVRMQPDRKSRRLHSTDQLITYPLC